MAIGPKKPNEIVLYVETVMYIDPQYQSELAELMTTQVFRPMAKDGKLHNVESRHTEVTGARAAIQMYKSGDPDYTNRGYPKVADEPDSIDFWDEWDKAG